jgi:hypothetical protein
MGEVMAQRPSNRPKTDRTPLSANKPNKPKARRWGSDTDDLGKAWGMPGEALGKAGEPLAGEFPLKMPEKPTLKKVAQTGQRGEGCGQNKCSLEGAASERSADSLQRIPRDAQARKHPLPTIKRLLADPQLAAELFQRDVSLCLRNGKCNLLLICERRLLPSRHLQTAWAELAFSSSTGGLTVE